MQVELARYNMPCFLHSSLSPIAVFSSSVVHPLSSLSCAVYVFCDQPGFRCQCRGSHRNTSLIISSLFHLRLLFMLLCCSCETIIIIWLNWCINALLFISYNFYIIKSDLAVARVKEEAKVIKSITYLRLRDEQKSYTNN